VNSTPALLLAAALADDLASSVSIVDCVVAKGAEGHATRGSDTDGVVALSMANECGKPNGTFPGGTILRPSGFAVKTAAAALVVGWSTTGATDPSNKASGVLQTDVVALIRCKYGAVYSAAANNCTWPFQVDALLGFAFAPLRDKVSMTTH
jgi:hypothetical protein